MYHMTTTHETFMSSLSSQQVSYTLSAQQSQTKKYKGLWSWREET